MPGLIPSILALSTAAITASPALPPPDPDTWSRSTSDSSAHCSGGHRLSAEEARALQEEIRHLVAELTVVADDFRATALGNSLRSMGFTPAVETGWRQQVHDMADTLMRSGDEPMAGEIAVRMASAGFSPTPADLRFGPAARSGLVAAAAPVDPDGTTIADLLVVCSAGRDDENTSEDARAVSWEEQGRELADLLADIDDPAADDVAEALADAGLGGDDDRDEDRDRTGSDGDDRDGGATEGRQEAEDWEDQARDLTDDLAGAGDDPATRDITDALDDAGISGEDDSEMSDEPGSESGSEGRPDDDGDASTDGGSDEAGSGDGNQGDGNQGDGSDDGSGDTDRTGTDEGTDGSDESSSGDGDGDGDEPAPTERPAPTEEPAPAEEPAPSGADDATWARLAACESTNTWDINTGNGYFGGLQFDQATWDGHGGGEFAERADLATREQQIEVAERLRDKRGGYGSWPACARKLGLPR